MSLSGSATCASLFTFATVRKQVGQNTWNVASVSGRTMKEELRLVICAQNTSKRVACFSLIGDIALKGGEPQVHAHLVIGRQDGSAHGGHLLSATVRPTCEIVITESPKHLQREIDPESGIALIRL